MIDFVINYFVINFMIKSKELLQIIKSFNNLIYFFVCSAILKVYKKIHFLYNLPIDQIMINPTNNTIEIKSTDVVQLILQYLKQNKFSTSFKTFQQESGVTLNQLNQTEFITQFKAKNWTYVMTQLSQLMLSQQLFFITYEFICDNLIEKDQFQAVAFVVNDIIKPNIKEMSLFRQKIMRLQYIIQHPDQKNLYKNPPTPARQSTFLNQLLSVSTQAQPQRLLSFLTQSLKYQVSQGVINPSIKLNLFSGVQQQQKIQQQAIIKQIQKTINYTEQSKITQLKLSWSEEYLVIGGVDGLIELYNTRDYSLYDNQYQRQGQMFFHDYPIQCMEFNYTDQMLASVDTKGIVNIWNLQNGKLLRKIDKETSLNAICWGVDPSHLIVGYRQTLKLYGIRSCNVIKQYKCSNSQYISIIFVSQTHLYSITNNGTISIFNYATSQLVSTFQSKQNLVACFKIYTDNTSWQFSKFYVAFKKKITELDQFGMEGKNITVEDGDIENCIGRGEYLYICVKGQDNKYRISVMEKSKKKIVYYTSLQSGFQNMLISRRRNLLITYDEKHKLSFWRPG